MDDAHRQFQAALRLTPGDTDVASAYAQTVLPGPNPRAAIDAWRNVLRVNPHLVQAHATLARLYLKAGEPAAAFSTKNTSVPSISGFGRRNRNDCDPLRARPGGPSRRSRAGRPRPRNR